MGIEQLVDAFKGNPQPLQAKVQQAQQGQPPGAIPPDLEEAIALQKITEMRNSAQNQQAMQAGGAQPSVVEKLRQMLSAEQRQQGQPPQMPQGMPQGPQGPQGQPPMQGQPPAPQGQPVMAAGGGSIAQLMSNLGRHYAGGGIVAFDSGGNVPSSGEFEGFDNAGTFDLLAERIREETRKKAEQELNEKIKFLEMAAPEVAERVKKENAANLQSPKRAEAGAGAGGGRTAMVNDPRLARNFNPTPTGPGAGKAPGAAIKKEITGVSPDDIRPAPSRATTSGVDSAPMPSGLAGLPSVGVGRDYERRMLAENQKFDPKAYREQFLKEVGPRDLSVYDEMAAELKARKERLNAPQAGFDSLMEYLGQIAQSGGRNWMESGARGAAGVKALQKERQAQQDALVDKILDIGSKKKEAQYNERLGLFNLTKTEQDRVKTESKDIAKSLGLSEDKEIEQRQQMTIEMMRIKTQKEIEASRAASRGTGSESKNMTNAINAVKNDEVINRLQKRAEELGKSMLSRDRSEAAGILKQIEDRQNAIYRQFGVLAGLSTMATAPGAASPGGTRPPLSSFQR
jgi:hypothetical protein